MKPIIKKFLVLIAVLCASIYTSAYDFEVDGIYYNVVSLQDLTCEVTSGDVKYQGDVIIPSTLEYNNRKLLVTRVGQRAFKDCTGLTSVTFPESVTNIGSEAFSGCSGLSSVTFPENLTGLGNDSFEYCSGLTSVTFPETLTGIGANAFYECKGLTSVTFPETLTIIGSYAFYGCSRLDSVILPKGLTTIYPDTFEECSGLTSVALPEGLTTIGSYAFASSGLTSVTFPETLATIDFGAFARCSGLTVVTFPKNVTRIGSFAFEMCKNIHSIRFEDNANLVKIEGGAFHECSSIEWLKFPKLCVIDSKISQSAYTTHDHKSFYVLPKCDMKYLNTGSICITCYNIYDHKYKDMEFIESVKKCEIDTLEINNLLWTAIYDSESIKKNSLQPKVLIFGQEYNTNKPEFNIGDTSKYREWSVIEIDGTFE